MVARSIEPFNVLIVDDEPGDVTLIKLALREGRFLCRVDVAVNGRQAMAMLNRTTPEYADQPTPDLVLLDLNMPQMNGKEVLEAMKSDPRLGCIPVVVLTTSDVERDIATSYCLGAAGFVTKPVDMDQMFRAIHGIEDYWFGIVRPAHPVPAN